MSTPTLMDTPTIVARRRHQAAVPTLHDEWDLIEARLVASETNDLLEQASAQLARLNQEVLLPAQLAHELRQARRDIEFGRARLAHANAQLG